MAKKNKWDYGDNRSGCLYYEKGKIWMNCGVKWALEEKLVGLEVVCFAGES